MNPSDYQPVVPTALRSLYSFARGEDGPLVLRFTYPQEQLLRSGRAVEGLRGAAHLLAEQFAFVRLATAQRDAGDRAPGELLPECVDAPHPANARRTYHDPVALDDEALKENLAAAQATLADLQRLWPDTYRLVQNWLKPAGADALRSALEPIAGSQSEQAYVPPGAVGFARFLRGRPVFAGCLPASTRPPRAPRNFEEFLCLAVTGKLPDEASESTGGGAGDFEFPEPVNTNNLNP